MRRDKQSVIRLLRTPLSIGAITLIITAVVLYFAFTKQLPFQHPFQLKAQFDTPNPIRPGSLVRIAGVDVGKVTSITAKPGTTTGVVTMDLSGSALPIHQDALAKIRPRTLLEGNFFVDLQPGSPASPKLKSGATLPITHTARAVQLDEVLSALKSNTRQDLRDVIASLANTLANKPNAASNESGDPSTRGLTAAQALNRSYQNAPGSLKALGQVTGGLLGEDPATDLPRLISGGAATTAALVSNERALKDLISNMNTALSAFAAQRAELHQAVALLPGTLQTANGALTNLNNSFPPTRAFALEIIPGIKQLPATIKAADPWIVQARDLVSRPELGKLASELAPASESLAKVAATGPALFNQIDLATHCIAGVLLPTFQTVIKDQFNTGQPNYRDLFYGLVGFAGEGENHDGNGNYIRFGTGGAAKAISIPAPGGSLWANPAATPVGTQPKYPGRVPPYNSTFACYKNAVPNLNGPAGAKGPADGSG